MSRVYKCDMCGRIAEDMVRGKWFRIRAYTGELKDIHFHLPWDKDKEPGYDALSLSSPECVAAFGTLQSVRASE